MKTQHLERQLFPNKSYREIFLKIVFCVIATLFLWTPITAIGEEDMCSNLKKVNNIDEMLYQFYIHLDGDCLFTMPLSDLEEAWGIKILSNERVQLEEDPYVVDKGRSFNEKPYLLEVGAFYVLVYREDNGARVFYINLTEAYRQAQGSIFPDGHYPQLMPNPYMRFYDCRFSLSSPIVLSKDREIIPGALYQWFNSKKTRSIQMFSTREKYVTTIQVRNIENSEDIRCFVRSTI